MIKINASKDGKSQFLSLYMPYLASHIVLTFILFSSPQSYRYEDKMRYQQLLQQFTDSPILPESYSVYKGSSSVSVASDRYVIKDCLIYGLFIKIV